MRNYYTYIPRSPLSSFVNTFWLYEGDAASAHAKERLLPHGKLELVINLHEGPLRVYSQQQTNQFQSFRAGVVCGAYSTFFTIDTACLTSVMGINFKPGGAFPFLKLPVDELSNAHVSLETLWGTSVDELRARLLVADTPQKRFSILERALLARTTGPLVWHPAIAFALAKLQNPTQMPTISEITEQTGLSSRRFIQLFRARVGLTPKQFQRVRRFQEVLRLIEMGEQKEWTELAIAGGYFDQAHLIHDFQSLSGLTPGTYRALHGEFRNHVPLPVGGKVKNLQYL